MQLAVIYYIAEALRVGLSISPAQRIAIENFFEMRPVKDDVRNAFDARLRPLLKASAESDPNITQLPKLITDIEETLVL